MKRSTAFLSLASWMAWSCGGEELPSAPSGWAGTYVFVSVTEKARNTTLRSGDVADLDGPGALPEGAITGSLVLTETNCTFTWITTPAGAEPVTATARGTYTVSGTTITFRILDSTITDTIPVGTDTLAIELRGNRLTLEDDEKRFVYDRR